MTLEAFLKDVRQGQVDGLALISASVPKVPFFWLDAIEESEMSRVHWLDDPIEDLSLSSVVESLESLTRLMLCGLGISDAHVATLVERNPDLTHLNLSTNRIGEEGAEAIGSHLNNLTHLAIDHNTIGPGGARALAAGLSCLSVLEIEGNEIGNPGLAAVVDGLAGLEHLDVAHNGIGMGGIDCDLSVIPRLAALDMAGNILELSDVAAIASGSGSLRDLVLLDCGINRASVEVVSNQLCDLTSLVVSGEGVDGDGITSLARRLTGLVNFSIIGTSRLGGEALSELSAHLAGLSDLTFVGVELDVDSVQALCAHQLPIEKLEMFDCGIEDTSVAAVTESMRGIRRLGLGSNRVGCGGIESISQLARLESLDLQMNDLSGCGVGPALARLRSLAEVSLRSCRLTDECWQGTDQPNESVRYLDSSRNLIGDLGVSDLVRWFPKLEDLCLSDNRIGDEGADAIGRSLGGLVDLRMNENRVSAAGAFGLLEQLEAIEAIGLDFNPIDPGSRAELQAKAERKGAWLSLVGTARL